MKNIKIKYLIIIFCSLFLSQSCQQKKCRIQEGTIKYKITYLKDKTENPLVSLLPNNTKMYFKDNLVQFNITGWMGVFESKFIKDSKNKSIIVALKMLNKKIYYKSSEMSNFMGMGEQDNNLEISFDNKTKKILDYKCKHATIHNLKNNSFFDLYYTDEIGVENPNINTVYEPIKGVLMEMLIEVNGIPMKLEASEIQKKELPNNIFAVPNDYVQVKKQHIDSLFTSISK